jgi:hypothetical protein
MAYQSKDDKKEFYKLLKSTLGYNTKEIGLKIGGYYSNSDYILEIRDQKVLGDLKKVVDFADANNSKVIYSADVSGSISLPMIPIVESFILTSNRNNELIRVNENMLLGWCDNGYKVQLWTADIEGRTNSNGRKIFNESNVKLIAFHLGYEQLIYNQTKIAPFIYDIGDTFIMQSYDRNWYFTEVTNVYTDNQKVNQYEFLLSNGEIYTKMQWLVKNSVHIKSFDEYALKLKEDQEYAKIASDSAILVNFIESATIEPFNEKKSFKMSNYSKCNTFKEFAIGGFDFTINCNYSILTLPTKLYKIFTKNIIACYTTIFSDMEYGVLKIQDETSKEYIYVEVGNYGYIINVFIES